MHSRNIARRVWLFVAASFLVTTTAASSWAAVENTDQEASCQAALTKAITKHAASVTKAIAACRDANPVGPCPDADAQAKIDKSASSAAKSAAKKCQSACSISSLPCIGTTTCPPAGKLSEQCTGGTKSNPFEFTNMGFPGPYCEAIIGRAMFDPADFGTCATGAGTPNPGVGNLIAEKLIDNIYGDLDGTPPLSASAASCLSAIVKSAPKTASKMAQAVSKCRTTVLTSTNPPILVDNCATADQKTEDTIASNMQKFTDTIGASCTNSDVGELDLCGGGITTVADAQACLSTLLAEVSYSVESPDSRTYSTVSAINGAYPKTAAARCGDNLVNQKPNQFLLTGEECDGTDDSACPGKCLPPGDTFECSCSNVARSRGFADGFNADLDNGWTGKSHNSKVTDLAGFVAEVANCDCDQFDTNNPATCLPGHSTDPVCDISSETMPRCGNHIGDHTSCDQVGDHDGDNTNIDCQACDRFSANAGQFCTGTARRCSGGTNDGDRCNYDTDCGLGGTCSVGGVCLTGTPGHGCDTNSDCGAGVCTVKSCVGGTNNDAGCTVAADCPGGDCTASSDCVAQCYPEGSDTPVANKFCAKSTDCDAGERCKGICDKTDTCVKVRNGAPLPLSANGTSVCVDSQFFTNITGTRNIQTGEHEINYDLRSLTVLAGNKELNSRPCPVCGGFCEGAIADSFLCDGTCTNNDIQSECRFGKQSVCSTNADCTSGVCGDGSCTCSTNSDCDGELCTGRRCRFDDDCGTSGVCSGTASPECATHGTHNCRLDLACGGGTKPGQACRIEAYTVFGTTSSDCPLSGSNISGSGLAISWTPLTSELVTLEEPGACDAVGFQNYNCNCVRGGGATRNQPNGCAPACNDPNPSYFGTTCASFTTCVGGGTGIHGDGAACDEDSDCTSGNCSGNPRVCGSGSTGQCSVQRCVGGSNPGSICTSGDACFGGGTCPAAAACTIGGAPCAEGTCTPKACTVSGDCDNAATCDNACPAGRCVPLCVPRGKCSGGDRDGQRCGQDSHCVGGGTCIPDDAEEGACAATGSYYHCDGPGWEYKLCLPGSVNTQTDCANGANGVAGDGDDNPGAGFCRNDINNCFLNNGQAEGGDIYNGKGDPTHDLSVAVFCIPASDSEAVNATAGLPGPGRIRQPSLTVNNFNKLPIP